MSLEKIVYTVEQGLRDLAGHLTGVAASRAQLEQEDERLGQELEVACRGLRQWQKELEVTRRRLGENQPAAVLLPSRVEECVRRGEGPTAYKMALELDRIRTEIAEDEEKLPRQEQTCWSLQFRVRQLLRQREEVRQKLARLD
jgi:hypothetical protein